MPTQFTLVVRLTPHPVAPIRAEGVGLDVIPFDPADDPGDLHVAEPGGAAIVRREVGEREAPHDAVELDPVLVDPLVTARAGALQRHLEVRSPLPVRRPPELDIPEEDHPVRTPVLDRVREHVHVHEGAVRLPDAELAQLPPSVPEPDRRLSRVGPGAVHVELEMGVELAERGRGVALDGEPALPHPGEEAAVAAELILEGGELGRPHHIEPGGVALLRLVPHVHHGESGDHHPGRRWGILRRHAGRRPGGRSSPTTAPEDHLHTLSLTLVDQGASPAWACSQARTRVRAPSKIR